MSGYWQRRLFYLQKYISILHKPKVLTVHSVTMSFPRDTIQYKTNDNEIYL